MAKTIDDSVLDAALNETATATALRVCAGQPVSVADAITKTLATETMTGGDFTIANGDTSGRKTTVAAQTGLSVTTSGTADHVSLDDGIDLLLVTTTASAVVLTASGTVDVSAFDQEIADPT